jgi:hypothetical protein
MFSDTPNVFFPITSETKFYTDKNNRYNYNSVHLNQPTTKLTTTQCHVVHNTDHRIKAVHTFRLGTAWSEHKHMLLIALLPLCTAQPSDQTYSLPQNMQSRAKGVTYHHTQKKR